MFVSLRLKNFQSHEDTFIQFHKGVNALIGLSDSGKSAILRALNWVLFNRPDGDEFRSWWGGDCEVELVVEEGAKVTRRRTKSDNAYFLDLPGEKQKQFRAFGRFQVPDEIQAVLRVNEINFQAQMDAPFLLSSSPGEVAQILNRTVNLDVIDSSLSNIRKKKDKATSGLKAAQKRVEDLTKSLESFKYLEDMEKDVAVLEMLLGQRDRLKAKRQGLVTRMTEIAALELRQRNASALVKAEPEVEKLLTLIRERDDLNKRADDLWSIGNDYSKKVKAIGAHRRLLAAAPLVESALELAQKRENLAERDRQLVLLVSDYRKKYELKVNTQREVKRLQEDFDRAMGDTCILCGQGVAR